MPDTLPAHSARRALAILGDRWTLLILRDAFFGVQRFGEWQARLGVMPTVLTRRLRALTEAGVFRRVEAPASQPRVEYRLTEKGRDIFGVALMILRWEQRWFADSPPVTLTHRICGHVTQPEAVCSGCHGSLDPRTVRYRDGPGAGRETLAGRRLRRAAITVQDSRASEAVLEHAVDILGDRWSWEVVGAAFLRHRRFDAIQAQTGIATNILSERLRRLAADGVIVPRAYQQRPPRYDYILTEKGRDFYPATLMLMRWGDRWLAGAEGKPMILTHTACGHDFDPVPACSACGEELSATDVDYAISNGGRRSSARHQD